MEHARCLVRCDARHHQQQTVADGDEDSEILAQLMAEVAAPKPAAPEMSSIQQQQQQQEEQALEDDAALRPAKRAKVDANAEGEEVERRLTSRLLRMRSGSGWPRPPPPPTAGVKGVVVVGSSKLPWHYLRRLATTKCGVRAGALATTTRTELLHVINQALPPECPNDDGDDDADSPPIDDEVEEEGELGDDELLLHPE
jgi:hypothetical protein